VVKSTSRKSKQPQFCTLTNRDKGVSRYPFEGSAYLPAGEVCRLKRANRQAKVGTRGRSPANKPAARVQPVFLVGFMGAGKTTVGEALAARLGLRFIDLDGRIEARQQRKICDIFRDSGESEFRRLESVELQRVLAEVEGKAAVVALGGGTFVHPANAQSLRHCGYTVFLDASVEQLWQRAQAQGARPLAVSENHFRQLYAARRSRYMEADCCVPTGGRPVAEVVAEIVARLPWATGKGEAQ
jgi:shikimate kinase